MTTGTEQRYRSGDICPEAGRYILEGCADPRSDPPPRVPIEILLRAGDPFPALTGRGAGRACYWRLIEHLATWRAIAD